VDGHATVPEAPGLGGRTRSRDHREVPGTLSGRWVQLNPDLRGGKEQSSSLLQS
jgi:hypothetical protein